ncbi:MAG: response regulator [Rhodothermales bacterium]
MIFNPDAFSVLFVDDEQNLLDAISRHFRRQYNVFTANSGAEALALFQSRGPFPIVISDMKMPQMNGVELLRTIRIKSPDTIRILLTGQAGLSDAISAINEGNIFRFLNKPCSLGTLGQTLEAARKQYELVTNQRILLEETLQGSIRMLVDILSLTNPTAFGKAVRARQEIQELLGLVDLEGADKWPIEMAAMLSQIGSVSLTPELMEKVYKGAVLTAEEAALVDKMPEVAESLLAHIPRIEEVRAILRYQNKGYDGRGYPTEDMAGDRLPVGSRMLKIVHDFDRIYSQEGFLEPAIKVLLKTRPPTTCRFWRRSSRTSGIMR